MLAALWALGFFVILMALSSLVRPQRRTQGRSGAKTDDDAASAEQSASNAVSSGETTIGKPWIKMSARYHILIAVAATFFLAVLLLFPPITTFRQWLDEGNGVSALLAVGMFLGTLAVALAHAWMKGDLSWVVRVETREENNGNPGKRVS
jgi:NADH:ubiquinone oxidoreductase subunit 3 (subunit A)